MSDIWVFCVTGLSMAACILGTIQWVQRQLQQSKEMTGERDPTEMRVRREPGTFLRQQLEESMEAFFALLLRSLLPTLTMTIAVILLLGDNGWAAAVLFAVTALLLVWLQRHTRKAVKRIRNLRLGLLGERVVAERLRDLLAHGWEVFHDLQVEDPKGNFNLDHVAVGPRGVFVIETKARRKHQKRDGAGYHEVKVEGPDLVFPTGTNQRAVPQVQQAASWVREFLQQRTGTTFPVFPVIVIPGWYVQVNRPGPVAVYNDKTLASRLLQGGGTLLTPEQCDLIRRQLLPLALEEA